MICKCRYSLNVCWLTVPGSGTSDTESLPAVPGRHLVRGIKRSPSAVGIVINNTSTHNDSLLHLHFIRQFISDSVSE